MSERYLQIEDGAHFEIDMKKGELLRLACCDCGLVHDIAFAIEPNGKLGIAMSQNRRATELRRKPAKQQQKCPIWVLELRFMARADKPLFQGLIEEEDGEPRWKKDKDLVDWLAKGWVQIVDGGFVITQLGRQAYEEEWAKYETPRR